MRTSSMSESEVSAEDIDEQVRWRPTPSRQATLTPGSLKQLDKDLPSLPQEALTHAAGTEKSRKRRKIPAPKAPELKVLPEMLPLFVEMVRPLLRPARTASASSYRSASYDPYTPLQQQRPGQAIAPQLPPLATTDEGLANNMQDLDLTSTLSPTSYVSSPFAPGVADGGSSRQDSRTDRLPGEYHW